GSPDDGENQAEEGSEHRRVAIREVRDDDAGDDDNSKAEEPFENEARRVVAILDGAINRVAKAAEDKEQAEDVKRDAQDPFHGSLVYIKLDNGLRVFSAVEHFHLLQAPLSVNLSEEAAAQGKLLQERAVRPIGVSLDDAAGLFVNKRADAGDAVFGLGGGAGAFQDEARLAQAHFARAQVLGWPMQEIQAQVGERKIRAGQGNVGV